LKGVAIDRDARADTPRHAAAIATPSTTQPPNTTLVTNGRAMAEPSMRAALEDIVNADWYRPSVSAGTACRATNQVAAPPATSPMVRKTTATTTTTDADVGVRSMAAMPIRTQDISRVAAATCAERAAANA